MYLSSLFLSLVVLQPSDLALLLRLLVRRMQLVDLLAVALAAGQVRPRAGEGGAKGRSDPREQLDKQEQHSEGEERQGVRLEHGVDAVLDNAQTGTLTGDALLHKCLDEGGRGRRTKRRRGKYSPSLAVEGYMTDFNTLFTGNMNIVVAQYPTLVRIITSSVGWIAVTPYLKPSGVDEAEEWVVLVELDILKHSAAAEHPYCHKAMENAGPGNEATVVLADLFVVQGGALVVVAKEERVVNSNLVYHS